ncbi:MAG: UDP-N-acetylmuramoyl-L-alanine--D-glutamate ligase [Bryobacteraceae bacterium]
MVAEVDLRDKHAIVIGTKRSGIAAIELLLKQGAHVIAMDADPQPIPGLDIPVVPQKPEFLGNADLIVLSPAVPSDLPMLAEARMEGVPVIGEVELSSYFLRGPVIGITGSNGKTTTTALTGHLLKECCIACQVGGNIGTAVTALIESSKEDQWNVLELSSFQLETAFQFQAKLGACLNVTPDHLDRHHTFESYAAAKRRLFDTQAADGAAVLNFDDLVCRSFAEAAKSQVHWFSATQRVSPGMWLAGEELLWNGRAVLSRSDIRLRGMHNVENVLAATLVALLAGADPQRIPAAVRSFPGVEHRLEFVRSLEGVEYFNDSKATNVDATLKAIEAFAGDLWIILGGKDKGSDYKPLREPLGKKGKGVLLIGAEPPYPYAAAPIIQRELEGALTLIPCGTLAVAVRYARTHAKPGDTVLLAPACASFDQFQNFEERGAAFKQLVAELS